MAMSLLLVVLVALASPFVAQASRASSDFDFFMFTTTWPGTFCDHEFGRHCKHVVGLRNLTIHGLWPNYDSGKYPQFCDKRKFDPDKVADLQDRLNAEWPDLLSKGGLWSHEFEKHGTCSASVLPTEHDYFGAALSLNERLDLTSASRAYLSAAPPFLVHSSFERAYRRTLLLRTSFSTRLKESWRKPWRQ